MNITKQCDHIKLSAYCGKCFIDIWLVTCFFNVKCNGTRKQTKIKGTYSVKVSIYSTLTNIGAYSARA